MQVRIAKLTTKSSLRSAARTRKKGRAIEDPMPQIISRISQQGKTRDQWDTSITYHLATMWLDNVLPADLRAASAQRSSWLTRISPKALRVLDEMTARQVVTLAPLYSKRSLAQRWRPVS